METKRKLALPIGVDNFEEITTGGYYYVDKTGLISDLLTGKGKVTLITRPRRFGKSLNMDMLKTFFEIGRNPSLFDGLSIKERPELFDEYMGKYPVVSVSFKSVSGTSFEQAKSRLRSLIVRECLRFDFLNTSEKLNDADKELYKSLTKITNGTFDIPDAALDDSLFTLTNLLYKHYDKKVIVLIDEYDVPLDKASQNGYYSDMIDLIRTIFGQVLKGNDYLEFAVLTGCLRVSKESIFTGLNNLKVNSITDNRYSEYFGFTNSEVKEMLDYYNMSEQFEVVKKWYNGYKFGNQDIYCPWDVINYCDDFLDYEKTSKEPKAYWTHTSDNIIIQQFLTMSNATTKKEIEQLIDGNTIKKKMNLALTYADFNSKLDNMWSYLFMTGYLTKVNEFPDDVFELRIPNLGIKKIFREQIQEWFNQSVAQEPSKLDEFCNALKTGDTALAEQRFKEYLKKTISIRDTYSPLAKKENFYHGILLGLFGHMRDWAISSNVESGDGYSDILIEIEDDEIGIVIEVKYAEKGDMDSACKQALEQIEKMNYAETLIDDGMTAIYKYGIACYKKQCRIARA